jgi:hypothetical protein
MSKTCTHVATIRDVTPSALGCEECLRLGQRRLGVFADLPHVWARGVL